MKWLVSAFEPFNGASTNSSQEVLKALARMDWRGRVEFLPAVPVEFGRGWDYLRERIEPSFDGVLALGQAESRARISLERVALNWIDARIQDNRGIQPESARILAAGPDMHWTSIPWDKFDLSRHCERSYSAGTFVCNEIFFQLMEWAKSSGKLAGFVHIPALSSQTETLFQNAPKMENLTAEAEVARILKYLTEL